MAMHSHDIDSDDLDFAMLTPATRPGPCRKAAAEETDATAATLAREIEAAPYLAEAVGLADHVRSEQEIARSNEMMFALDRMLRRPAFSGPVEVKWGSGKVKV